MSQPRALIGLYIIADDQIPLMDRDPDTGEEYAVMGYRYFDSFLMHPQRIKELLARGWITPDQVKP